MRTHALAVAAVLIVSAIAAIASGCEPRHKPDGLTRRPAEPDGPDAGGPITCEYGGKTYQLGDEYADLESCNRCHCEESREGRGITSCTEMYCPNKDLPRKPTR